MMMASSTAKICFNPGCKASRSESWRQGWRLRTGEYAELCDRCGAAFKDGKFCDMFHSEGAGWRTCESCGKRLHCGCIASIQTYVLLDEGGVDCMGCARMNASNRIWTSSSVMPSSERPKDASSFINWPAANGPNAVSGQWHQRPTLWSTAAVPSELHQRIGSEVNGEKLVSREHSSSSSLDKKKFDDPSERVNPGDLKHSKMDRPANGNTGADTISMFQYFPREEGNIDGLRSSSRLSRANVPTDARKGAISEPGFNSSASCANVSLQSSTPKDDPSTSNFCLAVPYSPNETDVPNRASSAQSQRQTPPSPLLKQYNANLHNGVDSSSKTQTRNGRPRCDARGRNSQELLPRYWPKITDQELQQISGDSNSIITPLFEKTLSASDAGRIGRLVLPKKCAEAYFPIISQPEGLPLKVQDASGKEWVFQFRFWPNNNSRMYVLEGVTPCIQSMQLMAGDTVTFSRLDPEGKLVMGFRKASLSVDQEMQALKVANGASKNVEVNRKFKPNEAASAHPRSLKAECYSYSSINQANMADAATIWANVDKSGYIAKDIHGSKSSILLSKRKSSTLGSKSKRLRMDNEELIELKLTWEEAQGLLRPPHNRLPTVVVIEGHEFEEFEEAPILGKPTYFTTNNAGEKIQWAQCEDCNKWRKIPVDVFLPSRWTCSDNPWNSKRSSCSSAGDSVTTEQLVDMLSSSNDTSRNIKGAKKDIDSLEVSEGLDALANLAIQEDGEVHPPSAPPTTRHPRHRPGCTCIVCIQPPSGKGPKHKDTCTCNVCLTVRRRFRTLMERREKRQSEKEAENARKKQQNLQPPEKQENEDDLNIKVNKSCGKRKANENVGDDLGSKKMAPSPFIGGIDLNIQPEREDEPSPVSDSFSMPRFERGAEDMHIRQLMIASADGHIEVVVKTERIADGGDGADGENLDPSAPLAKDHLGADIDHPVILLPASASATV